MKKKTLVLVIGAIIVAITMTAVILKTNNKGKAVAKATVAPADNGRVSVGFSFDPK